jgi:hypothetical protein
MSVTRSSAACGFTRLEKLRLKVVPALLCMFSNKSIAPEKFKWYRQKMLLEIFCETQILKQETRNGRQNGNV